MGLKKGYKQTEVGLIPEDWEVTSAANACERIQDGTHFSPRLGGNDYLYVTSKNIRFGYLDLSTASRISTAEHQSIYRRCDVRNGDLLLTKDGANTGNAALNTLDEEFSLLSSVAFLRFQPREHCAAYFLQQILTSHGQRMIQDAMAGNAITRLTLQKIRRLIFPVPSTKAEQEAIAEALSDADVLIESLEQLLGKKRHIKQGAMQELLTGKKRLPGFSGKWMVKALGDLFNFSGGFTASRDQLSSEGYCYLHYGDIHASKKMFVDVRSEFEDIPKLDVPLKKVSCASLLSDGDAVFVDASEDDEGTSRHVVVINPDGIPFISGLHTIVAKSKANDLEHGYRRYCFQTPAIKNQFKFFAVGTKVSGISKSNIAKVTLPIPPVPEQTAIAAVLSDIDAEIATLETKLTKARQLKTGMMQELLTGRIRLV
jgi:type I restriction enzyme S subunit